MLPSSRRNRDLRSVYLEHIDWPLVVVYARTAGRLMAEICAGLHKVDYYGQSSEREEDERGTVTVPNLYRVFHERLEHLVHVWRLDDYPGVKEALVDVDVRYNILKRTVEIWSSPRLQDLMTLYHPMSSLMEKFERENTEEEIREKRYNFNGVLPKP